jgi:hypothetical protein
MPTGTSTIFGAFQAIDFSPCYGANADGTPFFSVGTAKKYPSRRRPHSDTKAANVIAINSRPNSDRQRCRHGPERIVS